MLLSVLKKLFLTQQLMLSKQQHKAKQLLERKLKKLLSHLKHILQKLMPKPHLNLAA
jgi:hypothetical protein